jgi:hypothetical protein
VTALRDKYIGRLDVPMNDSLAMGGIKRIGDLYSQVPYLFRREGVPEKIGRASCRERV